MYIPGFCRYNSGNVVDNTKETYDRQAACFHKESQNWSVGEYFTQVVALIGRIAKKQLLQFLSLRIPYFCYNINCIGRSSNEFDRQHGTAAFSLNLQRHSCLQPSDNFNFVLRYASELHIKSKVTVTVFFGDANSECRNRDVSAALAIRNSPIDQVHFLLPVVHFAF